MRRLSVRIPLICILLWCGPALADDVVVHSWTPPFEIEVLDLPTAPNGVDYRLFVRKPIVPLSDDERPLAVFVLDALWDLPAAAAMHSNVEFLRHVPPLLLVGIGYQNETEGIRLEANRTRDYTPTSWAPDDPNSHFLKPVDYEGSGGADDFLEFVQRTIVPLMEDRYDIDRDRRVLVGKSMGGLSATHALLARPALFSHYLIISPALWWDDYFVDFSDRAVMRQERATHTDRLDRPTRVYFTMGELEQNLGMHADVHVLARALRNRRDPNLTIEVRVMDGETHEGAFARGYAEGIRALLPR